MHVSFFVKHAPVAKARPIFGKGHAYTPKKTKDYETLFAWQAKQAMKGRPPQPGPCRIAISFRFKQPKKAHSSCYHTSKPDLTNLIKAVEDGMNGIVYLDDSQVYGLKAEKLYSPKEGIFVDVLFNGS